jgi:hypothetical protein
MSERLRPGRRRRGDLVGRIAGVALAVAGLWLVARGIIT